MVTRPVTLKAMLRVCVDLAHVDAEPRGGTRRSAGSASSRRGPSRRRTFRSEGFYERFPAKGQVERVARIHRELGRIAGIAPVGRKARASPRTNPPLAALLKGNGVGSGGVYVPACISWSSAGGGHGERRVGGTESGSVQPVAEGVVLTPRPDPASATSS